MQNTTLKKEIKHVFTTEESEKIFFTSDTHFGHENILKYCNRPFSSIEEHDNELIKRWNEKVPEDGIVFHLGDIGFCSESYLKDILTKVNGKIYWIIGNHDWKRMTHGVISRFEYVTQQMVIRIGKKIIYLNHFPFLCFSGSNRSKVWNLYGHVHTSSYADSGFDTPRLSLTWPTQYDVGVDNNNFTPISFNEVNNIISKRIQEQNNIIYKE